VKLSDTEWQVMNALWKRHPATAREVADELPHDVTWAYTTLKTILNRLAAKGAVGESKRGNTSVYAPRISRSSARRSALGSLLRHAFDGAVGPLLHFLSEEKQLTPQQRQELLDLLADERNREPED